MIGGTIILYACGLTWLKTLTGMPWSKALAVGMYPFLIGDALKIVAAAAIAKGLRPIIRVAGYELRVACLNYQHVLGISDPVTRNANRVTRNAQHATRNAR
jgi:Kef-type K+ transport system membrane component KefB